MMGSAPEAHDADPMFGDETGLVGCLGITPRAYSNELSRHRFSPRGPLRGLSATAQITRLGSAPRTGRVGLHDEPAAVREKCDGAERCLGIVAGRHCQRLGFYLGRIGSASFSSMRYSGRRGTAGSSLILATLPLKQPPLAITSESVLMLPRTWPVAAISTLPVAVRLPPSCTRM